MGSGGIISEVTGERYVGSDGKLEELPSGDGTVPYDSLHHPETSWSSMLSVHARDFPRCGARVVALPKFRHREMLAEPKLHEAILHEVQYVDNCKWMFADTASYV